MRVLVTAATRHQGTAGIAEAIAAGLVARGVEAPACPIDEVGDLDGYDAVVLGSAVYMGRWFKPARDFAQAHAVALGAMPVWLFTSGPLGPADHLVPDGGSLDTAAIATLTGARGYRALAGRLDRARLGLIEKVTVMLVDAPEGDWRDWDAI
jgi:menaquinone-dependent protoporphyrinogen oxidase